LAQAVRRERGGRKLTVVIRDDTGIAPEVARRQAQELIVQEHVDILVGTNLTPNAIAVAQVSTQAKKPFFIVNSATSNVMKDQPYTARFGFDTQTIVPRSRSTRPKRTARRRTPFTRTTAGHRCRKVVREELDEAGGR